MVSYRRIVLWSHLPRRFANSSNHHEFEKTRRSDLRVERNYCGDVNQQAKEFIYIGNVHASICRTACHHELDANSK